MSGQHVSASMPGSSDTSFKEFNLMSYKGQAFLAIIDIFVPLFKPDVLLGLSREIAQPLMEKLYPIFEQAAQSLLVSECVILSIARQAFNPKTVNWNLHQFAISENRDYEVELGMAHMYSVQAEHVDLAEFDLRFNKLKQKLEAIIEPLASDQKCTFEVFNAFRDLTFQVNTEEDLASYLINQTSSFCSACIKDNDFTRPLLRMWFISEGAQHIETCLGILKHAVAHLDHHAAFKMMAIIYCGFKIQDATMLGHSIILGRPGDCRQPEKNRRAFFKCIYDLRHNKGFSQDLGLYGSYADNYC
ncbi:hypothetical protein VE00_06400 [Pseudogymnoascus sp. WSF 3629]|nr:hypothetical protein VE00_06400 [Pseudogymnoascus sp. WSF 3629]